MAAPLALILTLALLVQAPAATAEPPARAADVATPRAVVEATYAVISGPAGPRDWARFRSLFLPGARMTVSGAGADGRGLRTLSLADYEARAGAAMAKDAFYERGVRSELHAWAHTAVIRSLYESRHAPADARPFARGINTFVLAGDGARWWIASLSWEAETPAAPIPPDALLSQPPAA